MKYDKETSRLFIKTADGITFDLQLRHGTTIVRGDSGTGKTLLCSLINEAKKLAVGVMPGDDFTNVSIVDTREALSKALDAKPDLIIVDFADDILNRDLVEMINRDMSLDCLVFARKSHGFEVSSNNVGWFVRNDREVSIRFMTNIKGWS